MVHLCFDKPVHLLQDTVLQPISARNTYLESHLMLRFLRFQPFCNSILDRTGLFHDEKVIAIYFHIGYLDLL